MPWQRLGPRIAVARPLGELRAAFARTGLFALDLDGCIFPRISQEALGERIAGRLVRGPLRSGDRRFLLKLLVGGAYRACSRAKALLGWRTPVPRLVAWYEWAMRGIPEEYFLRAASKLPRRSFPLAAETIELLASVAPTGIATLGLDVVARAYLDSFRVVGGASPSRDTVGGMSSSRGTVGGASLPRDTRRGDTPPTTEAGLSFFEANTVVFRPGPGGERRFVGYDHERMLTTGEDKRRAVERRMAALGVSVPTTVGHNEDDLPLARLARERGGLAIGFNPQPRIWDEFDAVATGPDWEPVYALVAMLSFHAVPGTP